MSTENISNITHQLAKIALDTGAIKVSPATPFTWSSGYRMPIYNDNRILLGDYKNRALVADGFFQIIEKNKIEFDVIAGMSTAGIPHGTTLADLLKKPLIYVREKPKAHGTQNQIEGPLAKGQKVLLIEDLVSTGKSSIAAVEAIRSAGAIINSCLSIFNYGFQEALEKFKNAQCNLWSLLTYDVLVQIAQKNNYLTSEQETLMLEWSSNPFGWGERHGFSKVP